MSIVVIGSSNTDLVVNVPHIPLEGETVLGNHFSIHKGGKGANQAVAAARLGAAVSFIACIGQDDFGTTAINSYQQEGIDTTHIYREGKTSGVALITVTNQGNNAISVAPESNSLLSNMHIDQISNLLNSSEIILTQMEIPIKTIEYLIDKAKNTQAKLIVNPAPAIALNEGLYQYIDIITPNESEAELLTGIKVTDELSAFQASKIFRQMGVKEVIITLGAKGAYLYNDHHQKLVTGFNVNAVDATAAGDTFNGALAYAITQGQTTLEATQFANAASALAVTRPGAQRSTPKLEEVKAFMRS
ncbi:ribokinase [Thiotrichales bacterium 19S3-7]|nr:ribokinase [Thiotrichales bacterium 19S3-7]MCF6802719.1 ribokinase [Thiotrichales bacterium 19S3-11]